MSLSRIKYVVIFTRISNLYIYIYLSKWCYHLLTADVNTIPQTPGYGFVDFDSPAAALKAVHALKTSGIQAQMAKVSLVHAHVHVCAYLLCLRTSLWGCAFFLPLFFNACTLVSTVCWGMTLDRSHDLSWQAVLPVTPFTFTVETRCHISLCQITCQCNTLPTLLYTLYRILPGTLLLLGICSCYLYIVISAAVLCYSSTLSVEAFSSLCGQLKVKHTRIFLHNICDFSHSGLMSSSPFPFTCMLCVIEFTG